MTDKKMELPKNLYYKPMASFIEQFRAVPPKALFVELAKPVGKPEDWPKVYQELQDGASKHSELQLEEAMANYDTPSLNERRLQFEQQKKLERQMNDLHDKPLNQCGFTEKHTGMDVQQRILDLKVRYVNLNLVIQSEFKEYVIKHKTPEGMVREYISLKSPWYDETGEKRMGASINFGQPAENNAPGRFRDRTENLENMLARLYKRMGYDVRKQPRQGIMMPDLMVKKGDKEWIIEIKPSHVDQYKTMVMNFYLWSMYCEAYKPFDQPEW